MNLLSTGEFLTTLIVIHGMVLLYVCYFGTLFQCEFKVAPAYIASAAQARSFFPAYIDYGITFSSSQKEGDSGWHLSPEYERYVENWGKDEVRYDCLVYFHF